ncbi:uncharacterized protein METZ01_LOCUS397654 [marine metagenome]|uniref:Uncharacterized protein n=1 Tax=marine metagenome TaxID=408172 RepID=A0A382VEI7_9ZZZZ
MEAKSGNQKKLRARILSQQVDLLFNDMD